MKYITNHPLKNVATVKLHFVIYILARRSLAVKSIWVPMMMRRGDGIVISPSILILRVQAREFLLESD
jgi:hypothetical protein